MNLELPKNLANLYKNNSQKIRVITEKWTEEYVFCPNCGNKLYKFENNKPVADFYCSNCKEEFELKSKKDYLEAKINDGSYEKMIERINSYNNPNFLFLIYNSQNYSVKNFFAVPKFFFIENIIEKRKPLKDTAKRGGWVGCNILINNIPETGKIFYIKDSIIYDKNYVFKKWHQIYEFRNIKLEEKGWLFDILKCVEYLNKEIFTLKEIYYFEKNLKALHPNNNNIKAKIRQQLQILRDKGFIEFLGRGRYRIKFNI